LKLISELTTRSGPWQLLAATALVLELVALYFQYAMGLAPCIMCIYQRVALWSIFIAGIVGSFTCQFMAGRLLAYILWGTGSLWGLLIALEHVEMQANSNSLFFTCEFVPNFPVWAPLHQWIPALFNATGDCGEISWQFIGFSMPAWMVVIYALSCTALTVVLLARLIDKRKL
jgi:disulfide bond formation protein DsbB